MRKIGFPRCCWSPVVSCSQNPCGLEFSELEDSFSGTMRGSIGQWRTSGGVRSLIIRVALASRFDRRTLKRWDLKEKNLLPRQAPLEPRYTLAPQTDRQAHSGLPHEQGLPHDQGNAGDDVPPLLPKPWVPGGVHGCDTISRRL